MCQERAGPFARERRVSSAFVEQLDCTSTAPRRVRAWTAATLLAALPANPGISADRLDDISFCVGELVTMAVLAECSTVEIRLTVEPGCVRATVLDDGPLPREGARPPGRANQLGLRMISMIADRYGVDPTDGRQGRWLEFDLLAAGPNDLDGGNGR